MGKNSDGKSKTINAHQEKKATFCCPKVNLFTFKYAYYIILITIMIK